MQIKEVTRLSFLEKPKNENEKETKTETETNVYDNDIIYNEITATI
jgi:hypothetical protein